MEEILASIRRIISEDEPAGAASSDQPDAEPSEDVLDLTDPIPSADFEPEPEPEPVFTPAPRPAAVSAESETQGDLEIFAAPKPRPAAPKPAPRPAPEPVSEPGEDDALLSPSAAASVSSAFGQLARTAPMPAAGRSIEDVVREMLRPMLREWLDQHLPEIVEARVQAEVERLSRRG